jgi:hypothetical protein
MAGPRLLLNKPNDGADEPDEESNDGCQPHDEQGKTEDLKHQRTVAAGSCSESQLHEDERHNAGDSASD